MDFFELIDVRRSVRRFKREPVPEEDIGRILRAASLAPSATNDQPWRFLVVRDEEIKRAMREIVDAKIEFYLELYPSRREGALSMKKYALHFADAPVVIVVLWRPWKELEDNWSVMLGIESASVASAYIELAARNLGYGTCWCSSPLFFAQEELEELLGVKKPWSILSVIPLGVPDETPQNPGRKKLEEIVTFLR